MPKLVGIAAESILDESKINKIQQALVTFLIKKLRAVYEGLNNNSKANQTFELNNTFTYYSNLVWSSLNRILKILKPKSAAEINQADNLRTHVHLLGAIRENQPEYKTSLSKNSSLDS